MVGKPSVRTTNKHKTETGDREGRGCGGTCRSSYGYMRIADGRRKQSPAQFPEGTVAQVARSAAEGEKSGLVQGV